MLGLLLYGHNTRNKQQLPPLWMEVPSLNQAVPRATETKSQPTLLESLCFAFLCLASLICIHYLDTLNISSG